MKTYESLFEKNENSFQPNFEEMRDVDKDDPLIVTKTLSMSSFCTAIILH